MIEIHKLSDFAGDDGVGIVCDLLPAIGDLVNGIDKDELANARNNLAAVGLMFKANRKATLEIIKVLSCNPIDIGSISAPDISSALFQIASDESFFSLFGLQSKMQPTSGSAQDSTEGER